MLLLVVISSIFLLGYILVKSSFNLQSFKILFPFAFMTLFYVVPLFKTKKMEVSFRNFPFVKIISIAISWAGITVLFPVYEIGIKFTSTVYIEFFQRFLFLVAILIPFDIRDVMIDPKSLKTLPQLLGVDKSKLVGYIMLVGLIFLEFFKTENSIYFTYILIVVSLITALFLMFSSTKRTRYYTSFWVEAIPIIWFGLIILFIKM
ncbi:MAG: hypothetical protein HKP59_02920 [Lutibacter sp.]|uniref:hypothetical protein n=1 Tax=Lutibacter sp. TaxID=1925666 RepID=UPI00185B77B9|nr:hypothetical protein [Lutibacter sp.]MBT8316557.1 hypothetical protein [Lutibacter sp.]NNJ57417.1 hypothetical protein [Lutibacter sp.]